jgi:hypothetical protein
MISWRASVAANSLRFKADVPAGPLHNCSGSAQVEKPSLREVMALQKGEKYRCPDVDCGCEIEVTKGAAPGKGGDQLPRCCCGKEMQKLK